MPRSGGAVKSSPGVSQVSWANRIVCPSGDQVGEWSKVQSVPGFATVCVLVPSELATRISDAHPLQLKPVNGAHVYAIFDPSGENTGSVAYGLIPPIFCTLVPSGAMEERLENGSGETLAWATPRAVG